MELDEWELLSEDDELTNQIQLSPRHHHLFLKDVAGWGNRDQKHPNTTTDTIIHTDYFQLRLVDGQNNSKEDGGSDDDDVQIAPVQSDDSALVVKEVDSKSRSEHHSNNSNNNNNNNDNLPLFHPRSTPMGIIMGSEKEEDLNIISPRVFFKKTRVMEINQSVDMKQDSLKSINRVNKKEEYCGVVDLPVEKAAQGDEFGGRSKMELENSAVVVGEKEMDGLNLWRMGTTGIGAVCSFGFACATTICIVILGSRTSGKKMMHPQQQQKLRFQIYTAADKGMKDVVVRRTGKLNSAISRAEITVGGYYEGRL